MAKCPFFAVAHCLIIPISHIIEITVKLRGEYNSVSSAHLFINFTLLSLKDSRVANKRHSTQGHHLQSDLIG